MENYSYINYFLRNPSTSEMKIHQEILPVNPLEKCLETGEIENPPREVLTLALN
jgi:hypothetical protein